MSKVIDKTIISDTSYDFKVEPWMLKKSLAHHLFEQQAKRQYPGSENQVILINARNPKKDVMRAGGLELPSRKLSSALKRLGLKKSDSILLYVNSNVHFYCPVVAAWFLGGCASIVNPVLKPGTLAKHLAGTNIRHIFCGPCSVDVIIEGINIMNANKTEDQMEKIHIIVMEDVDPDCKEWQDHEKENAILSIKGFADLIDESEPISDADCPTEFSERDDSVIFWSSGTTGEPKGISIHFALYLSNIIHQDRLFDWPNTPGEVYLFTSNLFHGAAFTFVLVNGFRDCHKCVIFTPKSAEPNVTVDELYLACHTHRPHLMMIGAHHAILLGYSSPSRKDLDLSSVRWIMPLGAPIHLSLADEVRETFPSLEYLKNIYGMTETMLISAWPDASALGVLEPGVKVRIADNDNSTDDNIALLGPNKVGEIQALTPFLMKGYLEDSLNKKFWTKDGFGRTGDLGHYDENGILHFDGRLKDLIKSQGNHIYPKEMEEIIQKLPGVAEVVVFGIIDPVEMEAVTALVIPKDEYTLTEDEIKDSLVKAGLESYKCIHGGVKFVKEFPKNSTGKIERSKLPDLFLSLP